MIIADCGEIKSGEPWNYYDMDTSDDKLPPFPIDWLEMPENLQIIDMLKILNRIKDSGNYFFKAEQFAEANRKYKKAQRYYTFFVEKLNYQKSEVNELRQFYMANCLNCAAAELKLDNFSGAKTACNEVSGKKGMVFFVKNLNVD